MGGSTLYRAGALLLAAAILGVTICLTASNRDGGPGFSTPKTDRVITAFALTGEITGFVLALAGAALIFLNIFDEGDMSKIIKAVWCFFALLALWFIAGALGNWALRRDRDITNPRYAMFDGRVKAEIGFLILSSIVWLVGIVLAVCDPLSENSNGAAKVPSMALMALCFVLWVVILGLAASNRAGDGFSERFGPFRPERRTPAPLAGFALTGCILGIVFALLAIALLVMNQWEPSDSPVPIIRGVWLFFAGVALWFTGLAVGIWSHRFIEGRDFNPARNQRVFGRDDTLWSSQWKAEFAFEVITSFFWIITICWFAAYGQNAEGIRSSDGGREKPAKKPVAAAAPPPADTSRGLEMQAVDDEARRRQEEEERRRREEEEARRRQEEEERRRREEEDARRRQAQEEEERRRREEEERRRREEEDAHEKDRRRAEKAERKAREEEERRAREAEDAAAAAAAAAAAEEERRRRDEEERRRREEEERRRREEDAASAAAAAAAAAAAEEERRRREEEERRRREDEERRRRREEEERRRREDEERARAAAEAAAAAATAAALEEERRRAEDEERRRREEEERKAKEEAEFAAKRAAVPKKAMPKGKKKKGEEGLFDESGQINEGTLRKLAPNLTEDEALMTIRKFQAMDKDGSGELTFDELLVLLNDLLKDKMGEQNIRRFAQMQFQVADQDKSGSLNIEEFLNIYSFIKEQAPKRAQAVDETLASLAGRPGAGSAPPKQPQSARGGKK